ncbi:hypothetical protein IWZ01DRAFT_538664 [Phyllosticta capitalensis]|uniref:Uncharacterized protein n=1 Tax=Phyllosticta capitalensis TaxID=121624 RepID=A0ABR1Z1H2_9PEZI
MPRYTHDTSPWLKRVLIPFWVIRIILMVLIAISFGVGLAVIAVNAKNDDDNDDDNSDGTQTNYDDTSTVRIRGGQIATIVVFFVLVLVCLTLDIIAVVKHARHNLRPKTFLIFNAVQTLFWAAVLVIDIVSAVRTRSALSFLFALIVFALFLGLLIYAIVVYRRARRDAARGAYVPTVVNPALDMHMQAAVPITTAAARSPTPSSGSGNPNRLSARYYSAAGEAESGVVQNASYDSPGETAEMGAQAGAGAVTPVGSPFASQGPYAVEQGRGQSPHIPPPPPPPQPAGQGYEDAIEMGRR